MTLITGTSRMGQLDIKSIYEVDSYHATSCDHDLGSQEIN